LADFRTDAAAFSNRVKVGIITMRIFTKLLKAELVVIAGNILSGFGILFMHWIVF
jgi:hypothetical protein